MAWPHSVPAHRVLWPPGYRPGVPGRQLSPVSRPRVPRPGAQGTCAGVTPLCPRVARAWAGAATEGPGRVLVPPSPQEHRRGGRWCRGGGKPVSPCSALRALGGLWVAQLQGLSAARSSSHSTRGQGWSSAQSPGLGTAAAPRAGEGTRGLEGTIRAGSWGLRQEEHRLMDPRILTDPRGVHGSGCSPNPPRKMSSGLY